MTKFWTTVWGGVMAVGLGACGKIPSQFRGQYEDEARGLRLELKSAGGSWTRVGEAPREFEAKSLEVAALVRGEPGIYLRSVQENPSAQEGDLEVFWVNPDLATRREQYGFVSLRAQLLYSRFNAGARRAPAVLRARYCDDGQILVDQATQSFTGGCPATSALLELKRLGNG